MTEKQKAPCGWGPSKQVDGATAPSSVGEAADKEKNVHRTADELFTTIANQILQDPQISDAARGFACRILSGIPDDQVAYGYSGAWKQELEAAGYLRQEGGGWILGDAR
ncbi:hypothetical protein [Streptomyces pseudogriseolus]|uniref:hypothetical protein n=1 Tax=Streptomyces pseudogriseolus TaxID=36817 RepID=UPI003FA209FF